MGGLRILYRFAYGVWGCLSPYLDSNDADPLVFAKRAAAHVLLVCVGEGIVCELLCVRKCERRFGAWERYAFSAMLFSMVCRKIGGLGCCMIVAIEGVSFLC